MAEIPSSLLTVVLIDSPKFGRRVILTTGYMFATVFCFLSFLINNSFFYFTVAGIQFFINVSFLAVYPYTNELYPTDLRSKGVGLN